MSWQAMEAVQDHSMLNKQEQYSGLLIMIAIARFCDASGVSGRTRATAVSTEVIAEKAHVTKRTVLNWLPQLETIGELSVERNGMGRGKWNVYTINLPMPVNGEPIGERNGEAQGSPLKAKPVDNSVNGEPIGERNGESQGSPLTIDDLAVMVKQTQLLVNLLVKNGEPQSSPDTEIDTDPDTEKPKNIYIPPSPPKNGASHHEYLPEPVQQFVTALSGISKTPYLFDGIEAYHEAAYYLHGEDAELADIDRFSDWWHRYGFYEGQPALKTIIDSWRNFKNGVVPKLSKEKKRQDINSAIPAEYADIIQR